MKARQKINNHSYGSSCPRIHGHTKIIFADKFGRERVMFNKDNVVTDAVQKIFASNYFGSMDYSMLMPAIKKVLGGIVLFESTLGNDASDIWIPNSFDNKIIGHAGQTMPTSLADDITRGIPNSTASVGLSNGYKLVFNFPETQGNGVISAVGLCHSDFGDLALKNSSFKPLEMISNDSIESVSFDGSVGDDRDKIITFFDSVNGYSYTVINERINSGRNGQGYYSGYNEFKVIRRKNSLLDNVSVDMSHYLGNDEKVEQFTLMYEVLDNAGLLSNMPMPSFFIDYTNNLLWLTPAIGTATTGGNGAIASPACYDMTAFTDGATINPVKYQNDFGAYLGSNSCPVQCHAVPSVNGYFPAIVWGGSSYKFKIASYDSTDKEFSLSSMNSIDFIDSSTYVGIAETFPTVLPLGNYFYVRGYNDKDFCKLIETVQSDSEIYDVTADSNGHVSPYYVDINNPIVGATCWTYSPARGFTMGKSGVAINKMYLATKNDLPNSITKSPADSCRVEYTLTYT